MRDIQNKLRRAKNNINDAKYYINAAKNYNEWRSYWWWPEINEPDYFNRDKYIGYTKDAINDALKYLYSTL